MPVTTLQARFTEQRKIFGFEEVNEMPKLAYLACSPGIKEALGKVYSLIGKNKY